MTIFYLEIHAGKLNYEQLGYSLIGLYVCIT